MRLTVRNDVGTTSGHTPERYDWLGMNERAALLGEFAPLARPPGELRGRSGARTVQRRREHKRVLAVALTCRWLRPAYYIPPLRPALDSVGWAASSG